MKIGIIGLGDIAQKAYLPILATRENTELVLCTRNVNTLQKLAQKYRITQYVETVDELIANGIDAAFVNSATASHSEISDRLLGKGIPVYIDKPMSLNYNECQKTVRITETNKLVAMVGFNRRFVPMIRKLKDHGQAEMIIMQKNRTQFPDRTRRVIFEDFIHVVDTLRFLMDSDVQDIQVSSASKDGLLNNVVIQMNSGSCTAIGLMNRNNGVTEEMIEYMVSDQKFIVDNLTETIHFQNNSKNIIKFGDWESTLFKRGFYQIIDHFLHCVEEGISPSPSLADSLITHEICERIVKMIGE